MSLDRIRQKATIYGISPRYLMKGFLKKERHNVMIHPQIIKKILNWSIPYLPIKKRLNLSNTALVLSK